MVPAENGWVVRVQVQEGILSVDGDDLLLCPKLPWWRVGTGNGVVENQGDGASMKTLPSRHLWIDCPRIADVALPDGGSARGSLIAVKAAHLLLGVVPIAEHFQEVGVDEMGRGRRDDDMGGDAGKASGTTAISGADEALGVRGVSPPPDRQGGVIARGGEGRGRTIQGDSRLGFRVGFRLDGHDFLLPFRQPFRAEARKGETLSVCLSSLFGPTLARHPPKRALLCLPEVSPSHR